ncbi:relaxase/mobilization nuclease domain-containing protein [Nitrospirillum viridazoti]|uniref:MobA/VirD2-like nuclease domain-containing protein n=1 Tax=Nitrospirillum viridazoti CBAmc TaxID=1441467 RepID=A0A248K2R1_9PROT|nr:relaxase/mobilization nuclease domain-containing protein [Nitrospirillum amazonense]ASG25046.1 hypothetical protein Y958_29170 [Nitrospirillum amazonense CBAmc]TWB31200.1 relaxase/mobilization nuclease-like protein [Nitrospirillum amazonense]
MIEKITKGTSMRGLLDYLMGEFDHTGRPRGRVAIVGGSIVSTDVRAMAAEYHALNQLRLSLGKSVAHCSLSVPRGSVDQSMAWSERRLTDGEWAEIGCHWAMGMNFQAFTIFRHDGPDDDHIHVAASRVNPDGSVVPDGWDYLRGERFVREIERKYDLRWVRSSHLLEPENALLQLPTVNRGDIEKARKKGRLHRLEIAAAVKQALDRGATTFTDFVHFLWQKDIEVRVRLSPDHLGLNGLSFALEGVAVQGRHLGRGFSANNLVKRGLSYDLSRDYEVIIACFNRTAEVAEGNKSRRPMDGLEFE